MEDVGDGIGEFQLAFFHLLTVADDIDSDIGVYIADDIPVQLQILVDLNDVFPAQLTAGDVLQDRHRAVQVSQAQNLI